MALIILLILALLLGPAIAQMRGARAFVMFGIAAVVLATYLGLGAVLPQGSPPLHDTYFVVPAYVPMIPFMQEHLILMLFFAVLLWAQGRLGAMRDERLCRWLYWGLGLQAALSLAMASVTVILQASDQFSLSIEGLMALIEWSNLAQKWLGVAAQVCAVGLIGQFAASLYLRFRDGPV